MKERIAILMGYLENQRSTISRISDKLKSLDPMDEHKMIHAAYLLHNLYNAYEDLFQEIAVCFENNIERSSGYHKNILMRMKITIPGIRPAILSETSFILLSELLGFRHVFRHAYNYNIEPGKLQELRAKVTEGRKVIEKDISIFEDYLKGLLNSPDSA
jgi:hypothetical protein